MRNLQTIPRLLSVVIIFLLFASIINANEAAEEQISIQAKETPFKEFIESVSEKSGYQIIVSEELLDMKISGNFYKMSIEQVFHRVFRKRNVFQIIDSDSKELFLFTSLNESSKVYASSRPSRSKQPGVVLDLDKFEVHPGMTLGKLREMKTNLRNKIDSGELSIRGDGPSDVGGAKQSRADITDKMTTNPEKIGLGDGRNLSDLKETRADLDKKMRAGDLGAGDGSNSTLADLRKKKAEFSRKLKSGEIVITEDPDIE